MVAISHCERYLNIGSIWGTRRSNTVSNTGIEGVCLATHTNGVAVRASNSCRVHDDTIYTTSCADRGRCSTVLGADHAQDGENNDCNDATKHLDRHLKRRLMLQVGVICCTGQSESKGYLEQKWSSWSAVKK